jgi:CRISPR system Cascade subunit CasC
MTVSPLHLDIHALQTVPPSTLNRDETGTPKTATYGGAQRAMVSSQCWKRHMRLHFAEQAGAESIGTRTRLMFGDLSQKVQSVSGLGAADATRITRAALASGLDLSMNDNEVSSLKVLLFYSPTQLAALSSLIVDMADDLRGLDDKNLAAALKDARPRLIEALGKGHTLDIALFGRMVADRTELRVAAAASVQKAISTHAVDIEADYFTAVDDLDKDNAAAHLDVATFTSCTFYRYATISLPDLAGNLSGDLDAAVAGADMFLTSFVNSIPKGKQTSTAAFTLPSVVVTALRGDRPVSLADAFERPVRGETSGGYAEASARRLADHAANLQEMWGAGPDYVGAAYMASDAVSERLRSAFGASLPFGRLRAALREEISDRLAGGRA